MKCGLAVLGLRFIGRSLNVPRQRFPVQNYLGDPGTHDLWDKIEDWRVLVKAN